MPNDPTTAVLFPGQGSLGPDDDLLVRDAAPDLYDLAIELTGADPFERADQSTRFAQPAIFCASVAGWRRAEVNLGDVVGVAGHSLGEIAALVAAGAIHAPHALALVAERGRLMAAAGERDGGGTMLALLGAAPAAAEQLAADHGVTVANYNAPGQVVLSGSHAGLGDAAADARASGLRALDLSVAGAFHSPAMEAAVDGFAAALDSAPFRPARIPVMSCTTAVPMTNPRRDLAAALTRPVRWTRTLDALAALGATRFADAGPGTVVAKLARRSVRGAEVVALADLEPSHA